MTQRTFKPLGGCVPGQDSGKCKLLNPQRLSVDERIKLLEEQVEYMSAAITSFTNPKPKVDGANKDGIPVGTVAIGITEKSQFKFYLTVLENGYQVGTKVYDSLSAAAEAVSKVRRSGWTFWKLMDGRTMKEAYK